MDDELERELRGTLRAVLRESSADELAGVLDDVGWREVVEEFPRAASLLFDELGRAGQHSQLVDTLVLAELLPHPSVTDAVLYPVPARSPQPAGRLEDGTLLVDGWSLARPDPDGRLVFVIRTAEASGRSRETIATVGVTSGFDIRATSTLEVDGGWVHISASVPRSQVSLTDSDDGSRARAARTASRLGAATELAGLCHGALDLAVAHVRQRVQFGRPIGSFQAVRHRLAEAYASLVGLDSLVADAWATRGDDEAALALAYAGRAHRDALRQCLQVSGAMGLTWEHDLHRYLRRGFTLDAFFGPSDLLTTQIGAGILQA